MAALKRLQGSADIAAPASMVYQILVAPESYTSGRRPLAQRRGRHKQRSDPLLGASVRELHPDPGIDGRPLSGRLLRTSYYPKWKKQHSVSKNGDVWYPEEIRFYDEVEKANQTLVLIRAVDMRGLPANLFTKAWLESKSR